MADNPFSAPTLSGYKASMPADDGEQTEANRVKIATIFGKLTDPLRTFIDDLITQVTAFGNATINTGTDQANQISGSLAFAVSELTIASGAIAATRSYHTVDSESDAASDDLDNITTAGVSDGAFLVLEPQNASHVVTIRHAQGAAGQIHLADAVPFVMDSTAKSILLQRRGADWFEITRSHLSVHMQTATKTDTFTTANTAYTDVTDVEVEITTLTDTDQVLLFLTGVIYNDTDAEVTFAQIVRDTTPILIGDAAGDRVRAAIQSFGTRSGNIHGITTLAVTGVDVPGSAGTYTYKMQVRCGDGGTALVGRSGLDSDTANDGRFPTILTALRLAA